MHLEQIQWIYSPRSFITFITLNEKFKTKWEGWIFSLLAFSPSLCTVALVVDVMLMLLHHTPLLKKSWAPAHGSSIYVVESPPDPKLHSRVVHLLLCHVVVVVVFVLLLMQDILLASKCYVVVPHLSFHCNLLFSPSTYFQLSPLMTSTSVYLSP